MTTLAAQPPIIPSAPTVGHFLFENVSWDYYQQTLKALEETHVRVTYDRGRMELMSPLPWHEYAKTVAARLVEIYALEADILITPVNSSDPVYSSLGLIHDSSDPTRDVETASRLITTNNVLSQCNETGRVGNASFNNVAHTASAQLTTGRSALARQRDANGVRVFCGAAQVAPQDTIQGAGKSAGADQSGCITNNNIAVSVQVLVND